MNIQKSGEWGEGELIACLNSDSPNFEVLHSQALMIF